MKPPRSPSDYRTIAGEEVAQRVQHARWEIVQPEIPTHIRAYWLDPEENEISYPVCTAPVPQIAAYIIAAHDAVRAIAAATDATDADFPEPPAPTPDAHPDSTPMNLPGISPKRAARFLDMSIDYLEEICRSGHIKSYVHGKHRHVDPESVRAYGCIHLGRSEEHERNMDQIIKGLAHYREEWYDRVGSQGGF